MEVRSLETGLGAVGQRPPRRGGRQGSREGRSLSLLFRAVPSAIRGRRAVTQGAWHLVGVRVCFYVNEIQKPETGTETRTVPQLHM